ncbi:MAG: glycosyltransferase family 2 protein [Desulfobacterales bacterium]|nr:glycosyltransferase family 2 protein [Desulfobacterales bacterium]
MLHESSNKKIVVLILSYNGKHLLEESISSYLANDYLNFEVIIIDNGSKDGTKEWVIKNYPQAKVIRTEKNLAYSGGFNFGLEYAFNKLNSDYVLITNNDVKADVHVIPELLKIAESDESIGFVTGKVYFYEKPDTLQTVGYFEDKLKWIGGHIGNRERDSGQYDHDCERFMSDDIFMLVKKSVYEKTGGYNTLFKFQGEQADWQARAKKAGFKIYYAYKAKIWHKDSMTIGKNSAFKHYYDVRNYLILRFIHKDEDYLRNYFKWYLKSVVFLPLLKSLVRMRLAFAWSIVRGFSSAFVWLIRNKYLKLKYFI